MNNHAENRKIHNLVNVFSCPKCEFLIRSINKKGHIKLRCPFCGYEDELQLFWTKKMNRMEILIHNTSQKYIKVEKRAIK